MWDCSYSRGKRGSGRGDESRTVWLYSKPPATCNATEKRSTGHVVRLHAAFQTSMRRETVASIYFAVCQIRLRCDGVVHTDSSEFCQNTSVQKCLVSSKIIFPVGGKLTLDVYFYSVFFLSSNRMPFYKSCWLKVFWILTASEVIVNMTSLAPPNGWAVLADAS